MPFVYVNELKQHAGKTVTVRGWLFNKRSSGKLHFLQVRDGTGVVQCVAGKKDVDEKTFEACGAVTQESSVIVEGTVRLDERAPGGAELGVTKFEIHQLAGQPYPIAIQEHEHGVDFLMEQRHLWLRGPKAAATMRVRGRIAQSIRDFFNGKGFTLCDPPILTPAACEGTTTLFNVDYFEEKAYLTQSGQLYMEAAAMALGKVYSFGPTFRAEKSKTRRHLTEFWMVEPEVAWATLDDIMNLAEEFVCHIVQRALETCKEDLKALERDTKPLEKILPPFTRISYDDACKKVKAAGVEMKDEDDFGTPQEMAIVGDSEKPVMVHGYPTAVKAFYMKRNPANEKRVLCVDVLAPGIGEIIGGGQRADDLKYLEDQIAANKLPRSAFEWYLDLRKYGSVPHSGFGLGLERTVAWICGNEHVRECIPFPRTIYRIYP
ncbi:MAG: asparagine--tRNA ligase [Planctomycetes bacterium]|nr:asparagine--tRNA ligase [Planctomycetota bacterium]